MQETQKTWFRSLGQDEPLEEETASHFSILAWKIPWTEEPGSHSPWGRKKSAMTELTHTHPHTHELIYNVNFFYTTK